MKKEQWEDELKKKFFAGISSEEMSSNQVDHEELKNFISQLLQEREEKTIKECLKKIDTQWFATGLEPIKVQELISKELLNLLNKTV